MAWTSSSSSSIICAVIIFNASANCTDLESEPNLSIASESPGIRVGRRDCILESFKDLMTIAIASILCNECTEFKSKLNNESDESDCCIDISIVLPNTLQSELCQKDCLFEGGEKYALIFRML